jgi:membrane protein
VSGGRRVRTLVRRTLSRAWQDRILGLSAEAAFWQLLSLPSLLLAGIASLGYVSDWVGPDTVTTVQKEIQDTLGRAFSDDFVADTITPTLNEVLHGQRAGIISIGFLLALWAGSSGTATFVNTITIAYDMRDQRGAVRSRLLALGLFLGAVVIGVFALPLLVLGPNLIVELFSVDYRATARSVVNGAYYPVVVLLFLMGLVTLYHLAPPTRLPWRRGVPGAVLAFAVFFGGAAGLRSYITFIVRQNHAYGTLAAPIAALLFFFILALGVLLGAELNAAVEYMWPSRTRRPRGLDPKGWKRLKNGPTGALSGSPDADVSTGSDIAAGSAAPTSSDPTTARPPHDRANDQSAPRADVNGAPARSSIVDRARPSGRRSGQPAGRIDQPPEPPGGRLS